MLKSELVRRMIVLNPQLPEPVCRTLVDTFFAAIADRLVDGGNIELRGFGSFFLSPYSERTVRNPKNGATYIKKAFAAVRFRTAKSLREQLNAKGREARPLLSRLSRVKKQKSGNRSGSR